VGLDIKAGSAPAGGGGGGELMAGPGLGLARVREGTATFGLKYRFRTANLRAQIDSAGRVTALLERDLSPQIQVTFCGDIDHFKV
jgi:mitochondrial import receptor subunit TOM40